MEVMIPVRSSMDFDFSSARSTPYPTAPSTPKRFGEFSFSAPTSPTRASELYRHFQDELDMINEGSSMNRSGFVSGIPFDWEEKPGTPKSPKSKAKTEDDFAFDFSEELEKSSLSAEELFDGGKIKPLKPPPGIKLNNGVDEYARRKSHISPRSPKSPIAQGKKIIQNAFSPRHKKHIDPFSASTLENKKTEQERGRDRFQTSSNSSRRSTRSLSPYRVSQYPWEEEQQQQQNTKQPATTSKSPSSSSSASLTSSSSKNRKWSFKDFLLFRSASEGRASDKDPLKKYSTLFRKHEDVKNSSFRSTDSSNSGSSSKRRGPISAHELHYTKNRAASEDLKKKTFLPYKPGILGRFSFNPISTGFGTPTRG